MRQGKANGEKVKKRIKSVNRILDACDLAEKAGTVIMIAGIPALFIPILGSILAFTGVSIIAAAFAVKKRFRWVLVSNR